MISIPSPSKFVRRRRVDGRLFLVGFPPDLSSQTPVFKQCDNENGHKFNAREQEPCRNAHEYSKRRHSSASTTFPPFSM